MPSSKDSRRRHSRHSSSQSKTLSPPSTLSVLSTSTSGSNSTVTPDRHFRSRSNSIATTDRSLRSSFRPSKRLESKKPIPEEPVPTKDVQVESMRPESRENHSDKENLDVFPSKRLESKTPIPKVPVPKESVPTKEFRADINSDNPSDKENLDVFSFMVRDGQEVDSDAEEDDAEEDNAKEDDAQEDDAQENDAREDAADDDASDEEHAEEGHAASVVDEEASTKLTFPNVESSSPQASNFRNLEVTAPMTEQQQSIWHKGMAREASLHSDSGISVRSSSPDQDSPVQRHKYPHVRKVSSSSANLLHAAYPNYYALPTAPEAYGTRGSCYPRDWSTCENPMENPEAYYASTRPVVTQTMQRSPRVPLPDDHRRRSHQSVRRPPHQQSEKPRLKKSGYETLAAAIDSRGDAFLKPIYRKFETLNHRILLYLQDEISEIEEELRELDLAIAREDEMLGKAHASRRTEAKLPSHLQWRRLELLSRSYTKVEQYYRALSSYSNLTQSLEPASQADINTYQKWIAEHAPIAEQETAFLRRQADLIAVSPYNKKPYFLMNSNLRSEIETPAVIVAFTLVSAIIVFKFVPQTLARLVISTVFGVATLYTIAPSILSDVKSIRNWTRSISIYSVVMLVLAIVVS